MRKVESIIIERGLDPEGNTIIDFNLVKWEQHTPVLVDNQLLSSPVGLAIIKMEDGVLKADFTISEDEQLLDLYPCVISLVKKKKEVIQSLTISSILLSHSNNQDLGIKTLREQANL